ERRGAGSAREIHVGQPIAVAVERRDAAADVVLVVTVVAVVEPGRRRLLDEVRRRGPGVPAEGTDRSRPDHAQRDQDDGRNGDPGGEGPAPSIHGCALKHPRPSQAGAPARASADANTCSITRRFATASDGGTGVGLPSRTAAANASASAAYGSLVS